MNAVIFLTKGFEEMEAICVLDILLRADVNVATVSVPGLRTVSGAHKIIIHADKQFPEINFSEVDMLICPGGMPGAARLFAFRRLKKILVDFHKANKRIAAICAAPAVVLAPLGILDGKEATCYPGYEDKLVNSTISKKSVVTDGNVTTAKGPGVAQEFGLELVRLLKGEDAARKVAKDLCIK